MPAIMTTPSGGGAGAARELVDRHDPFDDVDNLECDMSRTLIALDVGLGAALVRE